jgi:hypothetical protein
MAQLTPCRDSQNIKKQKILILVLSIALEKLCYLNSNLNTIIRKKEKKKIDTSKTNKK